MSQIMHQITSLSTPTKSRSRTLVGILQSTGYCPHVCLYALGPILNVAQLLQGMIEVVNKVQPIARLLCKVGGIGVQLLRFSVKLFLVEVCLCYPEISEKKQESRATRPCSCIACEY